MYTAYFGFSNKPFKPREPKDFYHNTSFDAVCADILDSIRERRGFVLLTGEAGVGKSLVLRRCMADADDIRFIRLVNANIDFPDILNYLYAHLELPAADLDIEQRARVILENLAAESRHNRAITLLIDDAQHLSVDTLFHLHEFVETPAIPTQRLQVVLAGLPDLVDTLAQPKLHPLRDSIRIHCRLERLSALETGMFINHQLKIAGHDGNTLISPAAMERIGHYCQGVPRAIAILCDSILLLASLQSEQNITPALVDEAAQSCFLGDPSKSVDDGDGEAPTVAAAENADFDLDLSVFDSAFDVGEQGVTVKSPVAGATPGSMPDLSPLSFEGDALSEFGQTVALPFGGKRLPDNWPDVLSESAPTVAVPFSGKKDADKATTAISLVAPPTPALKAPPVSPPLNEFIQLLEEVAAKPGRAELSDREALHYFQSRYLRLAQGGEPARWASFDQRMGHLATIQQMLLVGLVTLFRSSPGQESVVCALLLNPTWWLYREIRLRLRSTDLVFANDGQMPPLRLLDGRDAEVVYLNYRHASTDSAQATLWLELDLCDHRGEWHAYNNSTEIKLDLPNQSSGTASSEEAIESIEQHDRFWPEPLTAQTPVVRTWLLAESPSMRNVVASREGQDIGNPVCTFPLELERDVARTNSLRSSIAHTLGRGTPLTRALLLAADPLQAPARIELVSRPFMIFGRHSSTAGTGFGDFTLGFVPKYTRISRLHCVVCALGDQLALMPASDVGNTYTGRNGQRLERGSWEMLEENDTLNICDLYRLKLGLAWDQKADSTPSAWDLNSPREKFGYYLLDLVEVLRKRDRQTGTEELHDMLRDRYLTLLRAQDRVAQLNGVGSPGSLLYARFEREDAANRQVIHFYVPKWLSLGSSPEVGLRIRAEDVKPHHAELLFRDGLYWIQNLADPGMVQVGHHGLATNEVLALEAGDVLMIGAAKFTFEAY